MWDVQQNRAMEDADGNVLTSDVSALRGWKEYLEGLLNEENEGEKRLDEGVIVDWEVCKINRHEVMTAVKRRTNGILVGLEFGQHTSRGMELFRRNPRNGCVVSNLAL